MSGRNIPSVKLPHKHAGCYNRNKIVRKPQKHVTQLSFLHLSWTFANNKQKNKSNRNSENKVNSCLHRHLDAYVPQRHIMANSNILWLIQWCSSKKLQTDYSTDWVEQNVPLNTQQSFQRQGKMQTRLQSLHNTVTKFDYKNQRHTWLVTWMKTCI